MALSAKLELRQGQQLVMTPQLQQAIRLLQLSNLELGQFVEAELERNPLLEREESEPAQAAETTSEAGDRQDETAEGEAAEDWVDLADQGAAREALDADAETVYPDASPVDLTSVPGADPGGWSGVNGRARNGEGEANLEAYVAGEISLKDHLVAQMNLVITGHVERLIANHMIDQVDEAGYLRADLDQLAKKLGAHPGLVESVLARLQGLDPPGVAARSLAECLALQLKDRNRYDPVIARLLNNLHLLAAHNLAQLRKAVGVDMDELAEMITEIRKLNPKPGLAFGAVQMQPVVADVIVRAAQDGSWHVELNSETLPRVLVNRSYYALVSKAARETRERDYLVDCLQTANWLVKSLDQRARTILRVAEEIVRQQDGFFTHGVQHLRPLNLKTVAEAIGMHESTVSRVTSNKYVATARGIFELKYFFTSAIASAEAGAAHSSEAVRHRIRTLVDAETADTVLSDDKIVEKLKAEGIDIARRTVAKYREAMRISSSVQRRREKKLGEQLARAS
jgi:RNA polymerase sigma-54 factor